MAGILERCRDIMASNVHALLDKCEDPEKMLDQELRKAAKQLAEIKEATASVMADEKKAQRDYDDAVKAAETEHTCAANALKSGDEAAARKFLASEQKIREGRLAMAEKTLAAAKANTQMMRDSHNKLADDIEWMQGQINVIKGTMKVARATETVNKAKGSKLDVTASMSKFGDKAQRALDEAQAKAELNAPQPDEMSGLREKYGAGAVSDSATDDALAKLRVELGGGAE